MKRMEALQKAAEAAGYAMAGFEDEPIEPAFDTDLDFEEARALAVYSPRARSWSASELAVQVSAWVRSHLPTYSRSRAPA